MHTQKRNPLGVFKRIFFNRKQMKTKLTTCIPHFPVLICSNADYYIVWLYSCRSIFDKQWSSCIKNMSSIFFFFHFSVTGSEFTITLQHSRTLLMELKISPLTNKKKKIIYHDGIMWQTVKKIVELCKNTKELYECRNRILFFS
jgi:hypothetical protein